MDSSERIASEVLAELAVEGEEVWKEGQEDVEPSNEGPGNGRDE